MLKSGGSRAAPSSRKRRRAEGEEAPDSDAEDAEDASDVGARSLCLHTRVCTAQGGLGRSMGQHSMLQM